MDVAQGVCMPCPPVMHGSQLTACASAEEKPSAFDHPADDGDEEEQECDEDCYVQVHTSSRGVRKVTGGNGKVCLPAQQPLEGHSTCMWLLEIPEWAVRLPALQLIWV